MIAQICLRLDGIPLAIELAAGRVRGLGVEQLASRLDDRFRLLTGGSRTALRRQQTLRATIDWSYDLLSEAERVLLWRLSVFVSGWSLEAAEEICQGATPEGTTLDRNDVLELLLRLVDRSLVVTQEVPGEARYRLLESIRQYGQERLFESGEVTAVRDRHLRWYLALAERGVLELSGREQGSWLQRFELEHDNLRGALAWGITANSETDLTLRLGAALGAFWSRAQLSTEAREWLGRVLATCGGEVTSRIKVLWFASDAEAHIGNHQRAIAWRQESLECAYETGDKQLIARALLNVSHYPFDIGDLAGARRALYEALDFARASGEQHTILEIVRFLATTMARLGDTMPMHALSEEGLALSRSLGDLESVAYFLMLLGYSSWAAGDVTDARILGEAGLSQARAAESVFVEVYALRLLGELARSEGDLDGADARLREMLGAWQRVTGNSLYATGLLATVAGLALARGSTARGLRILGAVHACLEAMNMSEPWVPGAFYQQDAAVARQSLGEEPMRLAWAEGQAMSLDQAVEYALAEGEDA